MVAFNTPDFDKAVTTFKADFGSHTQLFEFGQFYLVNTIIENILAVVESELKRNIRFIIFEAKREQFMSGFIHTLREIPLPLIDLDIINNFINSAEVNGDLAAIRAMFTKDAPGASENSAIQRAFHTVWSTKEIGSAPPWLGLQPSIKMARAARAYEKDRCFDVCRAFAMKLLAKRGITKLPDKLKISMGNVANAALSGPPPGPGSVVPLQTIVYGAPAQLDSAVAQMRAAIDAGAVIQCGVLSGARQDRSLAGQPEHYVMAFAYGKVDGTDSFLFWDPDAVVSNIRSTSWRRGFGCLFSVPKRLSTAIDDADLTAVDANTQSAHFGDHLNEKRRHRYQVFYLQTLPL
jgi:hypothetical protein